MVWLNASTFGADGARSLAMTFHVANGPRLRVASTFHPCGIAPTAASSNSCVSRSSKSSLSFPIFAIVMIFNLT